MPAHLIAEEGPHRGLILNLDEGEEWIIGRDPDASDLVIEDGTVSRKHVRLNKTPDGIYFKNLSRTNPALVNDAEFSEPVLLKEGDRIQIGSTTFLYSETTKTAAKKKQGGYDDIFGDLEPAEEEEKPSLSEETIEEPRQPAIESEELRIPPAPPKPQMTAYDTIFEDTGAEDILPFHLIGESPLILKVIAGPNAGAEIAIEKGKTYTIGKDSNTCDIVFQDMSVSRNHARLQVSPEGVIELEDLGSKNGSVVNNNVITEKKVVTPQDLIALGTTVFMIIDREAPQETIYSPMVPHFESAKLPEIESEKEETQIEAVDWKKQPIPMKYLIIGGSAAAIFLVMFLSFFSLFKPNQLEIAHKEPLSDLKEALAKFTDVQYSYNPGSGKLFLVGHVLTDVDYKEMKYRLGQINFITSIEDNVVIDEGVWKMMNDVLSENVAWRGISIHSPAAGKFVVNGYVPTAEEAAQLTDFLTVNFPYLDRLESMVVIEQVLYAQLQALITAANLGGVTFQLSNGNVILGGNYNEQMSSELKKTIQEIHALKGVSSVKNYAIASHPNRVGIDLSKDYHVTGTSTFDGRGFSVVMNGKIYTLGDRVDGMKITSIDANMILLEKDGLRYKIDYTR
ncbi:MAG: type III secretion system inner membrane ring subunit SctD [Verrucomicrobia bacterium]|nr:type III secretion system inner membrane ring subunit SctD [Verrucomicrobiota bacterium]MBU6446011.1 type III secretion system inner membrane ring subunit SctD [Verrucomicrobiota bacterium]MDE3048155.1 type III secretion system inner membrane ring subunit SctD [Verrucomicrobiota bacterium]